VWSFADAQEQKVVGTLRIPVDRALGEDIVIVMGWSSATTSQDCDWEVAYLITQIGEDTSAAAQETLQSYEESSSTANGFVVSEFTVGNAQIHDDDVCIHINIMRDGNDGSDNLGAAAHLHGICLKYTKDKLGTAL